MKESMYKHFCKDMKRLRKTETRKKKDKGTVISTFNVHFFQRGYSGICISNNFKDFEEFLSKEQPEFVLLQEVPSWDISKYLKNIGYSIAVSASCPECHGNNIITHVLLPITHTHTHTLNINMTQTNIYIRVTRGFATV